MGARAGWRWTLLAGLVFLSALAWHYRGFVGQDFGSAVLVNAPAPDADEAVQRLYLLQHADVRYSAWVVSRNGDVLLRRPLSLFDAEPCYPAERALALGEPVITMGLLAAPWRLLGVAAVPSYNAVLLSLPFIAALAMFWLIREWTGEPAAGIVAGLVYAFHAAKLGDVSHPYIGDTAWAVLGLCFAERFFARGRWRDAIGLAAACVLLLGGSLYPLLGCAAVALPAVVWLLARHGVRHLRPAPCSFVAACIGLAAWAFFHPVLEMSARGALPTRAVQVFLPWASLVPGGERFSGWLLLSLAALGVALPLRRGASAGRWALLGGAALALAFATGGTAGDELLADARGESLPFHLPNLYAGLAAVLPGLGVVRAPLNLHTGVHLALAALAGFGGAAILQRTPARASAAIAGVLIAVAWVAILRPEPLGFEPPVRYEFIAIQPTEEEIEFFRELEELGSTGPIFEAPHEGANVQRATRSVLLSAWHRRRTSGCGASYRPEGFRDFDRISDELPRADAVRELAEMGFTTIVVHQPKEHRGRFYRTRFDNRLTRMKGSGLRKLHETDTLSAWAIEIGPTGAGS